MERQTDKWTAVQTDGQSDRQTKRQTDRWTAGQTDGRKAKKKLFSLFSGETRTRTTSVAANFARFH